MIPELGHGYAVNVAGNDSPSRIRCHDGPHNKTGETKRTSGEDAEVLEEDGKFGECQTGIVHGNCGP